MKKIIFLILILNSLVFSKTIDYYIVTSNSNQTVYAYEHKYASKPIAKYLMGMGSFTVKRDSVLVKETLFKFKNKSYKDCQEEVFWTQLEIDKFKRYTYKNGSRSIYSKTTIFTNNDTFLEYKCENDSLTASLSINNLSKKNLRAAIAIRNVIISSFLDSQVYFTKRRWILNY